MLAQGRRAALRIGLRAARPTGKCSVKRRLCWEGRRTSGTLFGRFARGPPLGRHLTNPETRFDMKLRSFHPFAIALVAGALALSAASLSTEVEPARDLAVVEEGTFDIDGGHSSVIFKIVHMNVAPFFGRFNDISGEFTLAKDASKSSVHVEIKADSVDSNSADRDKHIKSPDFLNAAQFPVVTFDSTKVEVDGDDYKVTGDMKMHGVTKEVTVALTFVGSGERGRFGYRAGFEGHLKFKRSDFGMSNMLESLSDEIELHLGIEGTRK